MKRVAPTINLFLHRPVIADPPLCSYLDIERITLKQLLDMHEVLDLRAAAADKALKAAR